MKLRELFDNPNKPVEPQGASTTVGVCFGRFNPPHKGHRAAWETAAQFDHYYIGTNQNTQGPNDPLPYDVKLVAMATIWPEVEGHVIPETNLFTLASKVYDQHGDNVDLKVCTDEAWLTDTLVKYNGVEGKHGYYKFNSIEQVPTPRLSSATALRAAVRSGDREAFSAAAGVSADTPIKVEGKRSVRFFDLVKHYLDQFPEPVKKTKKEVAESKGNGKLRPRDRDAQRGIIKMRDVGGYDRVYHLNRIMMAAGMSDGTGKPVDMDGASWIEKFNSGHPFTEEEYKMLQAAMKTIPTDGTIIQKWSKSKELDVINKTSPVAKPKRNKYGI